MSRARRQRLRYEGLDSEVFPDGLCRVEVRLEWSGRTVEGTAEGTQPLEGELRTAAYATLAAAEKATDGRTELSLLGLKTLRAFDEVIVVAAVRARAEGRVYKLLGVKAAEGERPVEASARAVLAALNRVLELYVTEEPDPGSPNPDS